MIAAALLMDHYVPEILALPPRMVFYTLYKEMMLEALQKELITIFDEMSLPISTVFRFLVAFIVFIVGRWYYYDSRVFESTLKVVFNRKESLFRPFVTSSGPLFSRAKFSVIATSISRNTHTFIIGCEVLRLDKPSRRDPTRLLLLGTGIIESAYDRIPHFRHIFSDGFLRRGFDVWMSSIDIEQE
ncbi:hypothetical protein N7449_009291 [Penicillium cf. viridicatum]|uniref:Uncharacterized protein n=1 Tax=Penicillium cf. viridicatum TaxID=2972119 RepID=A0A9W9M8X9_9EURO|nr:hypothetical protein N7449_009291 [Penicillium cf. viridicatum]